MQFLFESYTNFVKPSVDPHCEGSATKKNFPSISLFTCHMTPAVDSLEFHWRTLVPFALELYFSSAGVPLENLSSTGAPGDAPGHGQAVPQPGVCPGHQTHG